MLIAGGVAVALAALLGGTTGFGFGLVATPLLLLLGFPLPFVVPVNLALALLARIAVAVRFRQHVTARRAGGLVLGSVPGLVLGVRTAGYLDARVLRLGTGLVVIVAAALMMFRTRGRPARPSAAVLPVAAGTLGGFLGTTTSLNGVPPVLLLSRDQATPRSLLADLAVYFVASNTLALALLLLSGGGDEAALRTVLPLWLPGVLLANGVGTWLGGRLPERGFRRLTLLVVLVSGAVTCLSALPRL